MFTQEHKCSGESFLPIKLLLVRPSRISRDLGWILRFGRFAKPRSTGQVLLDVESQPDEHVSLSFLLQEISCDLGQRLSPKQGRGDVDHCCGEEAFLNSDDAA